MDEDGILYFSFASDSVFLAPTDAVSLQPVNTSTIIRNTTETLDVRMGNVYFKVAKNPFEIRITTGADNRDEMVISGPFKEPNGAGICLPLDTREKIMGGGARAIDINRRGRILQLSNQANYGYAWGADKLNYSLPLFYSSKNTWSFLMRPSAPPPILAPANATDSDSNRQNSPSTFTR